MYSTQNGINTNGIEYYLCHTKQLYSLFQINLRLAGIGSNTGNPLRLQMSHLVQEHSFERTRQPVLIYRLTDQSMAFSALDSVIFICVHENEKEKMCKNLISLAK